jgi:NADH-quinone oxidoreductase subunit M
MLAIFFTRSTSIAMTLGFAGTLITLILSFYLLSVFDPEKGGIQLAEQSNFLGVAHYSVGVDGLNVLFIPMVAILTLLVLVYKAITPRTLDWKFIATVLVGMRRY